MAGIALRSLSGGSSGGSSDSNAVKTTSQTLTDSAKAQARTNIGAITLEEYDSSATPVSGVLYYTVEG